MSYFWIYLKNPRHFLLFWHFLDFLELFCVGKVMNYVYVSRDHGWLSVHDGLVTMGQHGHSGAWEVIVIARRERERRSLELSPMATLRDGAAEMTTRRRSTKATGGSPI
jgi:hypothetical protein